jgi:hypothetical protein
MVSLSLLFVSLLFHFLLCNYDTYHTSVSYSSIHIRYFTSYFHTFDAVVIVAGFIVDVLLHGILEEVASLVVILRLWRFFKIFEEFSVGAQEQMEGLELRIENLEKENRKLKNKLRKVKGSDEESEVGMRERS